MSNIEYPKGTRMSKGERAEAEIARIDYTLRFHGKAWKQPETADLMSLQAKACWADRRAHLGR